MSGEERPRLAIDTEAEAELRAGGELEGAWQVPSELARRAFRAGARRVSISIERSGFVVRDDGTPLPAEVLALARRAVGRHARGREEALARLEGGRDSELRFLAALDGARIEIAGSEVGVSDLRWDPARARECVRSLGRFAGSAIELDRAPVASYVPRHVAALDLASPSPGRLWLPESGEDGVLWLVRDRMVAAYLVLPGSLPFEAELDLSAAGSTPAAALREVVAPVISSVLDQAARLACETGARASTLGASAARRARVLLMAAARLPRWRGPALRAAAFPARWGGQDRWLSLADLGAPASAGPDRRIATCEPDAVARSLFLADTPAVLLDPDERSRLSQELGLRFTPVPLREGSRDRPAGRPFWRRLQAAKAFRD